MRFRRWRVVVLACFLTVSLFLFYRNVLNSSHSVDDINEDREVSKELTIICTRGRLGNQMFMYAILYGLSKLNQRTPVPPLCITKEMKGVFEYTLTTSSQLLKKDYKGHDIGRYLNKSVDLNIPPDVNIITGNQYAASYTFFYDVASKIRQEFTFTKKFQNHGDRILRKAAGKRNGVITFVGVHVRRKDFLSKLKYFNLREVTKAFFAKAFRYFRSRYSNCVFVVTSDEITWCKRNFRSKDVYFQDKTVSARLDLAVLARCNHTIIDYGTFGFWAAFLAGGETVYPANLTAPGSWYDLENPLNKVFYLPEWIGISEIAPNYWDHYKVIQKSEAKLVKENYKH